MTITELYGVNLKDFCDTAGVGKEAFIKIIETEILFLHKRLEYFLSLRDELDYDIYIEKYFYISQITREKIARKIDKLNRYKKEFNL